MDAMIFAAGLGTRLRPITEHIPKPLILVGGVPLLGRVLRRVVAAGADRVVVNAHHHVDQVEAYLREHDGFGADVRLSVEQPLVLDTGGGLLHAAEHFRRDRPILVHNGDVLSDVDLEALAAAHRASGALATLVSLPPGEERYLVFDEAGLVGYAPRGEPEPRLVRPAAGEKKQRDFAGIQMLDPRILDRITERGVFSIVWPYLRLSAEGEAIRAHDALEARWIDVGTPERLRQAEASVAAGELT